MTNLFSVTNVFKVSTKLQHVDKDISISSWLQSFLMLTNTKVVFIPNADLLKSAGDFLDLEHLIYIHREKSS